jgi:N-methylhydantoinase A
MSPRSNGVGGGFRIGVDVGGTFTDVTVVTPAGELLVDKALTDAARFWPGARIAVERLAERAGLSLRALLEQTSMFMLGTTRATNAVVEGTTARTAFLTTEGFPDILVLREGGKQGPFDFAQPSPTPYVPRRLTFEIPERIGAEGQIVRPLDQEATRAVLETVRARDVEAIAVCLLWSIANPAHEVALGELIEEVLPGVPYTLSHRINPILREYRRASSSAIDASLKPLMQGYIDTMARDLREAGLAGELLIATCFGGAMAADDLLERPILSVNSGPSLAPVAARVVCERNLGTANAIICDVGGTTFDVSLVQDGEIARSRDTWIGPQFTGHLTGFAAVDVKSVGAGGGSIAWVDSAGLLHVGPQSAGATPGPACYGLGGTRPTVTDAALVLGYLDSERFLGGRMRLDTEAAVEAIRRDVALPLGLDVVDAAYGVLAVSNETMVVALTDVTIKSGVDPRDFTIVAGGGGAGMSIAGIAGELGCGSVLVPRWAPVLSATGAHFSEILAEFGLNHRAWLDDFPTDAVNAGLADIEQRMDDFIAGLPRGAIVGHEKRFTVEAHYLHQVWELEVPMTAGRIGGQDDLDAIAARFHDAHERMYGVSEPEQTIECVHWTGQVIGKIANPELSTNGAPTPASEPVTGPAYFPDLGMVETRRYGSGQLPSDTGLAGPLIVDEPLTTIVVPPGWNARVSELGDYLLTSEETG